MAKITEIKEDRKDLTNYLIHFTRSQNGLSAFDILKSIVTDGYIRSGWSKRGNRRTVFGPKPAVCFSETPLYGFLDYVVKRNDISSIDSYGIFLNKKAFFFAGGRPVIYGTTLPEEKIIDGNDNYFVKGFIDEEQYRYILTAINEPNDWTHEREWRWCNWNNYSLLDGLPLWKIGQTDPFINYFFSFVPVGIIVKTKQQKDILLKILLDYFDAEVKSGQEDDQNFVRFTIKKTVFIVLDDIPPSLLKDARIEDVLNSHAYYKVYDELVGKYGAIPM